MEDSVSDEDIVADLIEGWLADFRRSEPSVEEAIEWLCVDRESPQAEMLATLFDFATPLSASSARTFIRGALLAIRKSTLSRGHC